MCKLVLSFFATMKLSRPSRFIAALLTIFSLLFTQLAVAAYACPASNAAAMSAMGDMAGCQAMDMDQQGLCAAHCDPGHQSLDTPGAPHVQPFVAAALAVVLISAHAQQPAAALPDAYRLTRTTAPPLSIRNCCFRI
jgi:hypothetical protein